MNKSYVTLEQHVCVVCGQTFDSGTLLLDKRLRERFDRHTVTGWGMYPDDSEKKAKGYIALVELDEAASTITDDVVQLNEAHRTGTIAHIKESVWNHMFNTSAPEKGMAFVPPEVIKILQNIPMKTKENIDASIQSP